MENGLPASFNSHKPFSIKWSLQEHVAAAHFQSFANFLSLNGFLSLEQSDDLSVFTPVKTSSPESQKRNNSSKSTVVSLQLKMFCAIMNSAREKKIEDQQFLEVNNPDTVTLQETKTDSSVPNVELFSP